MIAVVKGERDTTFADDFDLKYSATAEILFLIERLNAIKPG